MQSSESGLINPFFRERVRRVRSSSPRAGTDMEVTAFACLRASGEPRSAHPGTQWTEMLFGKSPRNQPRGEGWTDESAHDVLKSATWGSSQRGRDKWMSCGLFFSVRLVHLLKLIKAKGFYADTGKGPGALKKEATPWINEQLQLLEASGIPLQPVGTLSDEDANWFRAFLKTHA